MHSLDEGQTPIDLEKLAAFGEKVWPGGGAEILRLVEQVKAGQVINLGFIGRTTHEQADESRRSEPEGPGTA
jgi:hypothetical protein